MDDQGGGLLTAHAASGLPTGSVQSVLHRCMLCFYLCSMIIKQSLLFFHMISFVFVNNENILQQIAAL